MFDFLFICFENRYKCPKCRLRYCSVKCCKVHKTECQHAKSNNKDNKVTPSYNTDNNKEEEENVSISNQAQVVPVSRYLPSDALTRDPLESAIKRRKILDEEEEEEEEEGWKITREMMDKLDNSTWLKDELADGGLRQLISEIDSAGYHDNDSKECHHPQSSSKNKRRIPRKKNNTVLLNPRETALARAKLQNQHFATFIDKLLLTAGVVQHMNGDWDTEEILTKLFSGEATMDDVGALRLVPIQKQKANFINANTTDLQSSSDSYDSSSSDGSMVSGSESDA